MSKGKRLKKGEITSKINIRIIAIILVTLGLIGLLILESSFAFFSDYIMTSIGATSGTVKLKPITLLIDGKEEPIENWKPGDVTTIEWTVENAGNKSIYTRSTLEIGWDTTEDLPEIETIYLYPETMSDNEIRADIINNDAIKSINIGNDQKAIKTEKNSTKGYTYIFLGNVLDGVGNDAEVETSSNGYKQTIRFKLAFSLNATVAYQKLPIYVSVSAEALQFRNNANGQMDDNNWPITTEYAGGDFSQEKEMNKPILSEGMIPIKWTDTNEIIKTDTTDSTWYEYTVQTDITDGKTSRWANVMLNDGATFNVQNKCTSMGSMFVWIPRYSYKIIYFDTVESRNNYQTDGDKTGVIGYSNSIGIVGPDGKTRNTSFNRTIGYVEVVFLQGTTNKDKDGKDVTTDEYGNYIIHPAFKNDPANGGWSRELEGIWVAKFEASRMDATVNSMGEDNRIKIVPSVKTYVNINISNMFNTCKNMITGDTRVDSHMMKSTQWGAVAYISGSRYGRNGAEITINNNEGYRTGYGGNTVSAGGIDNTAITANKYDGLYGMLASTTGNCYGIYDMSGGAYEYVMSSFNNIIGDSGFSEIPESKYYDLYGNRELTENKKGDSIFETTNWAGTANAWNNDYSYYLIEMYPWMHRGGDANSSGTGAGLFGEYYYTGAGYNTLGFRPVVIVD